MTSISATSSSSYLSPLQKLQDELQSEVSSGAISSSDQSALSSALNDINSSLQSESGERFGRRHQLFARRSEVEDRQPDCERGVQRQADQRSGHRAAGRLQGSVRQRRRLVQAAPAARITAITAAMAVRRPPTVRPRPTAQAAPAPPATFCSSFCSRCRIRCRLRHRHPTARPVFPTPAAAAARHSRRF